MRLFMTDNNLFYVCSLIEYIARQTKNKRKVVVDSLGIEGIKKQLHDAPVNHCLSFEQVGEEIIDHYKITTGDFDTITNCKYKVPSFQDIGKLYAIIVENSSEKGDFPTEIKNLFSSFISDEISRFNTNLYYQNPDFLRCSYKAGYLLE